MKNLFFVCMMSLISGLGIMVSEVKAQTVYAYTDVQYVPSSRYVDGYTTTYLDYYAGLYYDPAVRGELYRRDMNEEPLDEGYDVGFADIIDAEVYLFSTNYVEGKTYCTSGTHFIIDAYTGNRTIVFRFYPCITIPIPPPPTPTPPLPTPTPNVTSVTFAQIQTSTEPISPNPAVSPHNPGIGRRIFPDDDVPQDGVDRRLVRVTAALSQPIPNVLVYFRNFDLDDPATDPIIDPNGTAGNDNNGTPMAGQLLFANGCGANGASVFCPTDSSGVATIDFVVTRQPGDNFAIAAGVTPAEVNAVNINGIELTNGSGQNIPTNCPTESVCRSQMLTVWRRLHIEVDSMGESIENRAIGTIAATTRIRVGETVTVPLNPTTPASLEQNRFEGGRLFVNSQSLPVTCVIASGDTCNTATSVTVRGTGSLVTLFANTPFELYDDDDFNNDDGTNVDGDTGENIDPPNTGFMTANSDDPTANIINPAGNIYAQAYIHPVYDIGDNNTNTLFSANVNAETGDDIRALFDFDQIATEASTEFWTGYLLGGYQYVLARDGDPSTERGTVGITDVQNGVGSVVFMETNGPAECTISPDFCSIADTSAHEIGHLLNADEGDGGIMDGIGHNFSPTSIRKIRVITHP